MDELLERIKSLESKISSLESKQNNQEKMFGHSYGTVGDTSSDLIIKTKGQVKIQQGQIYIDLLKDGKLNVNDKYIFQVESIKDVIKDGIYLLEDKSIVLKISDNEPIQINTGNGFISYLNEQKITPEEEYIALKNIGIIKESTTSELPKSGIVYIESEGKIFIIKDGKLQEYQLDIQNPYTKPIIISKSSDSKGSLIIKGSGVNNSLSLDTMCLYSNEESYIDSTKDIIFKVGDSDILKISKEGLFCLTSSNLLPSGSVIGWTKNFIPDGWVLCDGSNDSLDLSNKFIRNENLVDNSTTSEDGEFSEENPLKQYSLVFIKKL